MVLIIDKEKTVVPTQAYLRCVPKPHQYPTSILNYMDDCREALAETTLHKSDYIVTILRPAISSQKTIGSRREKISNTSLSIIQNSIASTVPFVLLLFVAIAVTSALYFPAVVALTFIAGAFTSKVALEINKQLKIINPAFIKAALIALSGLALETIILIIARRL